jgi:hypothetical protein
MGLAPRPAATAPIIRKLFKVIATYSHCPGEGLRARTPQDLGLSDVQDFDRLERARHIVVGPKD